jgi:hypothetical protein
MQIACLHIKQSSHKTQMHGPGVLPGQLDVSLRIGTCCVSGAFRSAKKYELKNKDTSDVRLLLYICATMVFI